MSRQVPIFAAGVVFFAGALAASATAAPAADVAAGKAKYQQFCASCHGKRGKGDGPAAASLRPRPRDHTDAAYMRKLKDDDIFKIIKMGGAALGKSPYMPPWSGALSDKDIRNIVSYIRTLAQPVKK
ncbi:MAG: c-type cytochrome [Nitrospinota bacterium]